MRRQPDRSEVQAWETCRPNFLAGGRVSGMMTTHFYFHTMKKFRLPNCGWYFLGALLLAVTPVHGGSDTNRMGAAFQHHHLGFGNAPGETPDYPFGLKDVFTPFSTGKLNVNTADENTLTCIPGLDTTSVQNILKFRSGEGGTDGSMAVQNLGQLQSVVGAQAMAQINRYCTVRGSTYEVHATATIGDYSREYIAILFRNGPNVQVVSFHWN